ncbi:DNA glycosylase [Gymnopilus junonius]|uniref:DNA glycosylase n=1 Tax=Gymnopilus junonius TaxID=109634 RepID=A0A9P5TMU9_GYMJU|nr:DNA glycosylase [Gymnopilus junonius]
MLSTRLRGNRLAISQACPRFESSATKRRRSYGQKVLLQVLKTKKQKTTLTSAGESPFPDFSHPTPAEAREVFDLLSKAHGAHDPVRKVPEMARSSEEIRSEAPNVIEALVSTILSQSTSGANSSRAKKSLDDTFGRNDFAAIESASYESLVDAIRSGGLANKKAKVIQGILRSIKARHGDYSLQHLAAVEEGKWLTNDEIMEELVSYDGVGPKTASCVLLFCLGRDSFAVDTHVFRLSQVLGWIPARADRILAQAHLDTRIPDELKYGLHILLIRHGRICKGCKKIGSGERCILKTYLKDGNKGSGRPCVHDVAIVKDRDSVLQSEKT